MQPFDFAQGRPSGGNAWHDTARFGLSLLGDLVDLGVDDEDHGLAFGQVTADAGMDALAHAVEAYMTLDYRSRAGSEEGPGLYQGRFPLSDLLAERAIRLTGRHLRRAVYQACDVEAREGDSIYSPAADSAKREQNATEEMSPALRVGRK